MLYPSVNQLPQDPFPTIRPCINCVNGEATSLLSDTHLPSNKLYHSVSTCMQLEFDPGNNP